MNPKTLQDALADRSRSQEVAIEVRAIGIQAREDRKTIIGRMDQQKQLQVAKSAGATVPSTPLRS